MESFQVAVGNNKCVEFHGVKSRYPVGELVGCNFMVPVSFKPEVGDWVGIFPVGWSTLGHFVCKKMVKPENFWSTAAGQQFGKVDFDYEILPKTFGDQYYQFVYVKNGEYIKGASIPFMFQQFDYPTGFMCEPFEAAPINTTLFVNKQTPYMMPPPQEFTPTGGEWYQTPARHFDFALAKEIEKLESGIACLEQQGGSFVKPFEQYTTMPPYEFGTTAFATGKPFEWRWATSNEMPTEPFQIKKYWQFRVGEMQQMLGEQARIEHAQHKLEQLSMIAQLKAYERHIMSVLRKEVEIKEFLKARIPKQVGDFEDRISGIMKLSETTTTTTSPIQQQPDYYIKRYEQLLKEKIEAEAEKRRSILHKLRMTIKECERKLRDIQSGEFHYYARFHQALKTRMGQFETKYVQPFYAQSSNIYTDKIESDLRDQLKYALTAFVDEQRKEQFNFVKAQKQIMFLLNEICTKLQEVECGEAYAEHKIPSSWFVAASFENDPVYAKVKYFEQQLNSIKYKMMMKSYSPSFKASTAPLSSWEFLKPVMQYVKDLEAQFAYFYEKQQPQQQYAQWYKKQADKLNTYRRFFEESCFESKQVEELKLRQVLAQLREFECELFEYPKFFREAKIFGGAVAPWTTTTNPTTYTPIQMFKTVKHLQTAVREKIQYVESFYAPTTPIEFYLDSGKFATWRDFLHFEKKLVELKSLLYGREQYKLLHGRLFDIEDVLKECTAIMSGSGSGEKLEKYVEQIKALRSMIDLQQQMYFFFFYPTYFAQPEQFAQHQQMYDRFYQMLTDFEFMFYKQQRYNNNPAVFENTASEFPFFKSATFERYFGLLPALTQQFAFYFVHQQFERLVQEFYRQAPQNFGPKVEPIVSFFKNFNYNNGESFKYKSAFAQELVDKMAAFEKMLGEPELEKFKWTFDYYFPAATAKTPKEYLKYLVEQVKFYKNQLQTILGDWVFVSAPGCCDESASKFDNSKFENKFEDFYGFESSPPDFYYNTPYAAPSYYPSAKTAVYSSYAPTTVTSLPCEFTIKPTTAAWNNEMDNYFDSNFDYPEEWFVAPFDKFSSKFTTTGFDKSLRDMESNFMGMRVAAHPSSSKASFLKKSSSEVFNFDNAEPAYYSFAPETESVIVGKPVVSSSVMGKVKCPVCGVKVGKEVADFDIHFETHF